MAAITFNAAVRKEPTPRRVPADKPATGTTPFRALDPDVVSEAIPAFFIGRNTEGFWVARDVNGRIGGIFLLENSALSLARDRSWPAGCATIYPSERFELDLENNGNPLIPYLGSWRRLARQSRQRMTGLVGKMTGTIKRWTKGF